ncbi:MAG: prepilin-type N-terminal cleavage/methylation domain-containing protein [Candidatus Saccharimonadales bacterium]
MIRNRYNSGFTIVELIVVIIVIAILAMIVYVNYGGIRSRAYNTQVIEGVRQYRTAIEAYYGKYGKYPQTTREVNGQLIAVTCLGQGYPDGYCGRVSWNDTYEDPLFNNTMSTFLDGNLPVISAKNIAVGIESFTGAIYGNDITDPAKVPGDYARTIQYALEGANADCILPGAWSYRLSDNPPTTACEIVLEVIPRP